MEKEIRELKEKGKTLKEIQEILGISSFTLSKYSGGKNSSLGDEITRLRREGKTLPEIKTILGCSRSTVSKYLARSNRSIESIRQEKKVEKKLEGKSHRTPEGSSNGLLNRNLRKRKKEFLLSAANNSCQNCGYDKCTSALSFHHLDESTKSFGIAGSAFTKHKIEKLISEAEKCIILCMNCHAEVHAGITDVGHIKPLSYSGMDISSIKEYIITKEDDEREKEWVKEKLNSLPDRKKKESIHFEVDLKKVSVIEGGVGEINSILEENHYLSSSKKGHIICFHFMEENKLIGGCIITNPIRRNFNSSPTCEISRFVLLSHTKNLASKVLSVVIKKLKSMDKWHWVQSYADPENHLGTIYKASNFTEVNSSYKNWSYDGINKKTIYERAKNLSISESEYAIRYGLKKIQESTKSKFVYKLY
jgi:DNA-binding CsgD family transcriptional regulator